jgi:hypothetical protein
LRSSVDYFYVPGELSLGKNFDHAHTHTIVAPKRVPQADDS